MIKSKYYFINIVIMSQLSFDTPLSTQGTKDIFCLVVYTYIYRNRQKFLGMGLYSFCLGAFKSLRVGPEFAKESQKFLFFVAGPLRRGGGEPLRKK